MPGRSGRPDRAPESWHENSPYPHLGPLVPGYSGVDDINQCGPRLNCELWNLTICTTKETLRFLSDQSIVHHIDL